MDEHKWHIGLAACVGIVTFIVFICALALLDSWVFAGAGAVSFLLCSWLLGSTIKEYKHRKRLDSFSSSDTVIGPLGDTAIGDDE